MSVQLLDKTRKINKLLHNNTSHKVVFNDICLVLGEISLLPVVLTLGFAVLFLILNYSFGRLENR